jgi:hypothetical protein
MICHAICLAVAFVISKNNFGGRELSNNGASEYYWTSGDVAGGRTDRARTFLPGPKLE